MTRTPQGVLEQDTSSTPFNLASSTVRLLATTLGKLSSGSPLVIAAWEKGPFRVAEAMWIEAGTAEPIPIESAEQLLSLVEDWSGVDVDPRKRRLIWEQCRTAAEQRVNQMAHHAEASGAAETDRQIRAAQERLALATCLTLGAQIEKSDMAEINEHFYRHILREGSTANVLKEVYQRLGSYPTLPPHHEQRLKTYIKSLNKAKKDAAQSLQMIQAALNDPRWQLQPR